MQNRIFSYRIHNRSKCGLKSQKKLKISITVVEYGSIERLSHFSSNLTLLTEFYEVLSFAKIESNEVKKTG